MALETDRSRAMAADAVPPSAVNATGREATALRPLRFDLALVPGFSLAALSCAVEVLRAARLEAPEVGFGWRLLAADGLPGTVASSSGIALETAAWTDTTRADAVVICGGERTHHFRHAGLEGRLREAARRAMMIGALSDGAFLVAETGLFDRARSTIHWKCQSAYRERHPNLDVRASILEIDGACFSCAGGTASLDLMLRLVARTLGIEAAGRIADNYVHDRMRGDDQMQHEASGFRFAGRSKVMVSALTAMEGNMETPLPIAEIARLVGTNPRQLDREFHRYLGTAPSTHYREMRLVRAGALLRQSGLSVGEIASACGFTSPSHLARHFRERYGASPSEYRRG